MSLNFNELREYFSTQPVDKAWLFGSFAREEEKPDSDIDILVRFIKGEKVGMKFIRIINDLEDKLCRQVDLVEENSVLPWIKPYIDKDKILIYERKN